MALSTLNGIGSGQRFGPDQNGCPEDVCWSGGKLNSSWLIWFAYCSWKWNRAHLTQSSIDFGRSSMRAV